VFSTNSVFSFYNWKNLRLLFPDPTTASTDKASAESTDPTETNITDPTKIAEPTRKTSDSLPGSAKGTQHFLAEPTEGSGSGSSG
jgi:hypothetical protein